MFPAVDDTTQDAATSTSTSALTPIRQPRSNSNGALSDEAARLIIVANRLPIEADEEGWHRAPGGLVTALESVLRDRPATWVGWSGRASDSPQPSPDVPSHVGALRLVPIPLTQEQVEGHYDGFSNGALWPNYHGGIVKPMYHREEFERYRGVNLMFAREVAEAAAPGAVIWVHDYQLQLVPGYVRRMRPDVRIGFFLHIPFPSLEQFSQLPWRSRIIDGLLGADVVGFQTTNDAVNFRRAAAHFTGVDDEPGPVDRPFEVTEDDTTRSVIIRGFPIGIDPSHYAGLAAQPEIQERARQVRADLGNPDLILLGVDRLDYTKGIDVRIKAITELLDGPLDPEKTAFVQVAPATRASVDEYQRIRAEVELLVGRANGSLGGVGTNPIHYMHQPMAAEELAALYVAADIMLVTPLRDGMNLVAKEYVATRLDDTGSLVLSEFAGAAEQMTTAWMVNPYDIEGTKATILGAHNEPADRARDRMQALREGVIRDDVAAWARGFFAALSQETSDVA